ncbi:hypothetical protein ACROYT_G041500 [Oculina patagonica]
MKAFFFLVVVLVGCANAKPYPAKRTGPTCSAFPKQLSGRLYMVAVDNSGSATHIDMHFNLDRDLQRMQTDSTVGDQGSMNMVMDYKGGKTYIIHPGGCFAAPLTQQSFNPEDIHKDLSYVTSGKLGLKGTMVDLYSMHNEEATGMFTLEAGDQCLPVSWATKEKDSVTVASLMNLKTTVDSEKLKIPEHCDAQISRRSIPALIHSLHLNKAVKRGFPWINAPVTSNKRGFPWIDLQDTRKREFPWIDLQDTGKRGFPWPLSG